MKESLEYQIFMLQNRLFKINIELVHEGYLDGWYLKSLRKEKENLENTLALLDNHDKNR